MRLDLSSLNECVRAGTKGLPPAVGDLRFEDIGAQRWNLLAGDTSFPAAVLKRSAIEHNVAVMQAYVARSGMRLAPHGKTTMCPGLFDRQLAAGAWGRLPRRCCGSTTISSVGEGCAEPDCRGGNIRQGP